MDDIYDDGSKSAEFMIDLKTPQKITTIFVANRADKFTDWEGKAFEKNAHMGDSKLYLGPSAIQATANTLIHDTVYDGGFKDNDLSPDTAGRYLSIRRHGLSSAGNMPRYFSVNEIRAYQSTNLMQFASSVAPYIPVNNS